MVITIFLDESNNKWYILNGVSLTLECGQTILISSFFRDITNIHRFQNKFNINIHNNTVAITISI